MRHNKLFFTGVLLGVSLICAVPGIGKVKADLSSRHQRWLEEVAVIMSSIEKEVFLKLENERERDIFIESFWKQRDPTPGTAENEFKREHYRRISYAAAHFGSGDISKGRRSDRGKVYIILGPPLNVHRYTSYSRIYPTEVWFYQQEPKGTLPPAFYVIFFDPRGTGEYVLYSPINDGPQKLLIGGDYRPQDYLQAYTDLYEHNAFLANVSISLIPGENTSPGQPSLASDALIQKINRLSQSEIDDIYAEKFLQFKDIVDVEYTANYMGNRNAVQVIWDSSGTAYVHYVTELERLSVNLHDDIYSTDLVVNGTITADSGALVYQFEKKYSVNLSQKEFETIKFSSFGIADVFPIIPGNYKFSILLKNSASKEFTTFERNFWIPDAPESIHMTSPILAHRLAAVKNNRSLVPFQVAEGRLFCDLQKTFKRDDDLIVFFQLLSLLRSESISNTIRLKFIRKGENFLLWERSAPEAVNNDGSFLQKFSLKDFPPDYYELEISIIDESGAPVLTENEGFSISPLEKLGRPHIISKVTASGGISRVSHILGMQYLQSGKAGEAVKHLEKAYHGSPGILNFALGLCRAYQHTRQYTKIIDVLSPFVESGADISEILLHMAAAYQGVEDFDKAVRFYEDHIKRFGMNPMILNPLGFCYIQLDNAGEARRAWKKSLELNPDQPKIKKLLDAFER